MEKTQKKTESELKIKQISLDDDLRTIAGSVVGSEWGEDNEMKDYDEKALQSYLEKGNILLIAYAEGKVAGLALATEILNPYKDENWLYIDEIDVKPECRSQGIGRAMMQKLFEIAKEKGLKETWLGTEPDNLPANALYKSLKPSETEEFVGYTYKIAGDK